MSTQDSLGPDDSADVGPLERALICDLRAWGVEGGVLARLAWSLASCLDKGVVDQIDGSRELRQLVKAIREGAPAEGPGEVERFLASIEAEGFGR